MLSACKYFIKWVLIYATKTYITKTYAKKHSKVINYTNIVQDGSAVSKGGPQMSAMSAFSTQRVWSCMVLTRLLVPCSCWKQMETKKKWKQRSRIKNESVHQIIWSPEKHVAFDPNGEERKIASKSNTWRRNAVPPGVFVSIHAYHEGMSFLSIKITYLIF